MNDTDDHITFDDILVERDEKPPSAPAGRPIERADEILARLALEDALDGPAQRRIQSDGTLAMVIAVPTAAWVGPMHVAASTLGAWDGIIVRSGTDHRQHQADRGNDDVMESLVRGRRVLGIAPQPDKHLPAALTGAADLRITIRPPSPALLRRVIRAVTGQTPRRVPSSLGAGLDVFDLCSAIRIGTTAGACVRRLEAATHARTVVDPTVATAPLLHELAGYGEAMTWAQQVVRDIEDWRLGRLDFAAIERCAVVAGPPGVGKTQLARSLARTANLALIPTSVPAWFSSSAGYLDSVIKEVDRVFAAASAVAPALLFIDEIEALPNRATLAARDRPWWNTLMAHLLTVLDGAFSGASSRLIILGATNHSNLLDEALVRPGRLSRIITVGLPSPADLASILRLHLGADLPDIDLHPLARIGAGASGAQAAAWVKAARNRARTQGRPLTLADLEAQICPPERRSAEDLRRCAVHEAGHACLMRLTGAGTVEEIGIADPGGGGHVSAATPPDAALTRSQVEALVVATLGGRAAEEVICGAATTGAGGSPQSDLALATRWLATVHCSSGLGASLVYRAAPEAASSLVSLDPDLRRTVQGDLDRLYATAVALVREHRPLIEAVADVVSADRIMSGAAFEQLFVAYARAVTTRGPRRRGGRHG